MDSCIHQMTPMTMLMHSIILTLALLQGAFHVVNVETKFVNYLVSSNSRSQNFVSISFWIYKF